MKTQRAKVRTKLVRHGKNLALVLDQTLIDELGIGPDTILDISTDGPVLIITPAEEEKDRAAFEAALEKVNRHYARALKRLAE